MAIRVRVRALCQTDAMAQPLPGERPAARWQPWWALVVATTSLLLASMLVAVTGFMAWILFSGQQYGIVGLPVGLVLLLLAGLVGGPAISYLRSGQRRAFVVSSAVTASVAAVIGGLVLWLNL